MLWPLHETLGAMISYVITRFHNSLYDDSNVNKEHYKCVLVTDVGTLQVAAAAFMLSCNIFGIYVWRIYIPTAP